MYRINGVSMPGFAFGILIFFILSVLGISIQKALIIAIVCWLIIDIVIIISMAKEKEPKEN